MTHEQLAYLQRLTSREADLVLDGTVEALDHYGNRLERDQGRRRCDETIAACRFAQRAIRERDVLLFLVADVLASVELREPPEQLLRATVADCHGLPQTDPRRRVGGPPLPGIDPRVQASASPEAVPTAGPFEETARARVTEPKPRMRGVVVLDESALEPPTRYRP